MHGDDVDSDWRSRQIVGQAQGEMVMSPFFSSRAEWLIPAIVCGLGGLFMFAIGWIFGGWGRSLRVPGEKRAAFRAGIAWSEASKSLNNFSDDSMVDEAIDRFIKDN